MSTSQEILVVYGVISIAFGFLLGLPLSQARMTAPTASRHLVIAHLSAIMQGAVHLGLATALALCALTPFLETTAALLLVTGSALFIAGATLNWRQHVGDHFAERSVGWKLFAMSSFGHLIGIVIVTIGVVIGV